MSNSVVLIDKVSKKFVRVKEVVQALRSLSLRVQPGEVFALLGPNGSGKTTSLNILSCLLGADEGSVELLGRKPGHPQYFDGVSFMSGDSEYYWGFTVAEILKFYGRLTAVPWNRVLKLVDKGHSCFWEHPVC